MTDVEKFIEDMNRIITEASTPSLSTRLTSLRAEAEPLLKSLRSAVESALALDVSQLKPEFQEETRGKHIKQAREKLFDCLKRHISLAETARGNALGQFMAHTAWNPPSEALSRMAAESQHREIKEAVRRVPNDESVEGAKISKRAAFVMEVCQGPDKQKALNFIHALSTSPDSLIGEDLLNGLRADFTRTNLPELYEAKVAADDQYASVRRLAGLLNAKAVEALGDIVDVISEKQRQEVFVPQGWHEKVLAEKRLRREQAAIDRAERDKQLEAGKPVAMGLSLHGAHQPA